MLAPPETYAEEAAFFLDFFTQHLGRKPRSLLELGSGVGGHATHWGALDELVLLDASEAMLAVSRGLNPSRRHVCADLRHARLDQQFESVLLHDAVMYLTSEEALVEAAHTLAAHLAPGGVALIVPDLVAETFEEGHTAGGGALADGRAARMLEWRWDPDPADGTFQTEMSFLLRDAEGRVEALHEAHTMGLFPRRAFVRALLAAGLDPVPMPMIGGDELFECFMAVKP